MKVTAIIPDELINDIKSYSKGKNITESLIIVLNEWVELKKIKELNERILVNPLEFNEDFSAEHIREINRQ